MASIHNQSMTLQPSLAGVTVTVSYTATFSPIEIGLLQSGLVIEERIHLFGVDEQPAGLTPLWTSQPEALVLPSGGTTVTRTRGFTLPRMSLQEDTAKPLYLDLPDYSSGVWWKTKRVFAGYLPDDDEVLARVQLSYVGLQSTSEADAPIAVLRG